MPDGTRYGGERHMITDDLNLQICQPLERDLFPILSDAAGA